MDRKHKIIISVVGIIIVVLALIGITYAYFLTQISGNTNTKSIEITTADFRLRYSDGTDGIIFKENITPGTEIGTKTFSVTNTGQTKIDNYGVYLENIINDFKYTNDVVYTLSCSSSFTNKDCSGKGETTFPTVNELIISNEIESNEVQTFTIKINYKETGTDQSDDMNKHLGGKIQIYDLNNIVDVSGNVTGYTSGDYVEMHSDTVKVSQIDSNGNYKIAGVEVGEHTLYIKSKANIVKGSTTFTIKNSDTSSVDGSIINVTKDIQNISMNVTNISSSLTTSTPQISKYNPYDNNKNSLAYNIIISAQDNNNGTVFRSTPLSQPSTTLKKVSTGEVGPVKISSFGDPSFMQTMYFDTYDDYESWNPNYGNVNCDNGVGKYIIDDSGSFGIHKIIGCKDGEFLVEDEIKINESELSVFNDSYGKSYYYRGDVKDNYVSFANYLWRIVRIQGDGSVKLIKNEDISYAIHFGYKQENGKNIIDFNNTLDKKDSIKFKLDLWYNTNLISYDSKLKSEKYCIDLNKYDNKGNALDSTATTGNYGAYNRLVTLKQPSFKCIGDEIGSYKISIITADEMAFAGARVSSNYVVDFNYMTDFRDLWTLSPYNFNNYGISIFNGAPNGVTLSYSSLENGERYIYPIVVLNPNTNISSGNGTKSNPYIID